MATLLTAILCFLLRNSTKRIKQEILDTDTVQLKPSLATHSNFSKILTSQTEKILYMM